MSSTTSGHEHDHAPGALARVRQLWAGHSHDHGASIDQAAATSEGIRALKVSLLGLAATAILQLLVYAFSGSVALLADTVHNFSDALTAVPLGFAFWLGRRQPTSRYTYGYGRAEDLAGIFIVAMFAASAVFAGWQSVQRLLHPAPVAYVGWVIAASIVGFAGNELVAIYRIRVGRRIGSAALVADGLHARTDGLTSLAVLVGAIGVAVGFPLADPLVGLLITVASCLSCAAPRATSTDASWTRWTLRWSTTSQGCSWTRPGSIPSTPFASAGPATHCVPNLHRLPGHAAANRRPRRRDGRAPPPPP